MYQSHGCTEGLGSREALERKKQKMEEEQVLWGHPPESFWGLQGSLGSLDSVYRGYVGEI